MSVRIIVDSTSDVTPEVRRRLNVVPLTIRFGDDEYVDGITISHKGFYEKLIESDSLPVTSQATPESFAKELRKAREAGDSAVIITLSSKLSGTYQSAMIAAEEFSDMEVYVVDSESVAIGTGILAEFALTLVDSGMDAASIAERVTKEHENVRVIAMLDTLEYLKQGGRISKAAAIAGGILSIKPVITLEKGEIVILGKARGSRQGNNLLVKEIQASGGVDFSKPLLLGYTGLSDVLLQKYIEDSAFLWDEHIDSLRTTIVGSVIGTHAGPGVVAAAYFKK